MHKIKLIFLFLTAVFPVFTQSKLEETKIKLPQNLTEISGLELYNDSILCGINDSGNDPVIYFFSPEGKIVHTTLVSNAKNHDWEDLTADSKGNLYIADCGNNGQKRKNLAILKVNMDKAFSKDSVEAEFIYFHYEDQTAFPPQKNQWIYDCEAIFWKNDSLFLISKSRGEPWTGEASIYTISDLPGTFQAVKLSTFISGSKGWKQDAVTAADYRNGQLVVLTYTHLLVGSFNKNQFTTEQTFSFRSYDQKESLVIASDGTCWIASEYYKLLGGPFLYEMHEKKK